MSIRFGVSPIAWANDDMPELGGDTPLDDILRDIHELGFEGVELGGKFPRDAASLREVLSRHQLDLIGGWYSGSLLHQSASEEIAALQPHLALLKALGSTVFVFAETSNAVHGNRTVALDGTPRLAAGDWPRFGARLTEVADYIQAQGLRFAYHHHLGTVVERGEDVAVFLRHTGATVGFTLDTGHAALGGVDALELIRAHPARIAHVHCKDVRWDTFKRVRDSGASFLDGVLAGMFTVPGDGFLDYASILRVLAEADYSGWLVVEAEQDPRKAHPLTYATMGFKNLSRLAREAGFLVET